MPGRHATTERPASTGWRAMSAAVRASSPESTAKSVSCRPSSLYAGAPQGYAGVRKPYSRGYAVLHLSQVGAACQQGYGSS